jgi:hypothetical protein
LTKSLLHISFHFVNLRRLTSGCLLFASRRFRSPVRVADDVTALGLKLDSVKRASSAARCSNALRKHLLVLCRGNEWTMCISPESRLKAAAG